MKPVQVLRVFTTMAMTMAVSCGSTETHPQEDGGDLSSDDGDQFDSIGSDRSDSSSALESDTEFESDSQRDTGLWIPLSTDFDTGPFNEETCEILGAPKSSRPLDPSHIFIDGQSFAFNPIEIETVRADLFEPGHFSIFDILVHLKEEGLITLDYSWDATRDTHIIAKMQGKDHWWYTVYYSGGWPEQSMHRLDYYPVKDHMSISFVTSTQAHLKKRYDAWATEVSRKISNEGLLIVPTVTIVMKTDALVFNDVLVESHNLRSDFLSNGVMTTADVIMSMSAQGLISCTMEWYDFVSNAIVGQYYVESINGQDHTGHCGFVHESGEDGDAGNHIHIVPDLRIIHSPEYVLFYWIELGPC